LCERTSTLHYWLEAEEPCCAGARVEKSRFETIAQRHICSADGATWRVRQALPFDDPGSDEPGCLLFESETTITRLSNHPANRVDLSTAELFVRMTDREVRADGRSLQESELS
jgi:hypothetical protein